jgi:hypothetical protein
MKLFFILLANVALMQCFVIKHHHIPVKAESIRTSIQEDVNEEFEGQGEESKNFLNFFLNF